MKGAYTVTAGRLRPCPCHVPVTQCGQWYENFVWYDLLVWRCASFLALLQSMAPTSARATLAASSRLVEVSVSVLRTGCMAQTKLFCHNFCSAACAVFQTSERSGQQRCQVQDVCLQGTGSGQAPGSPALQTTCAAHSIRLTLRCFPAVNAGVLLQGNTGTVAQAGLGKCCQLCVLTC